MKQKYLVLRTAASCSQLELQALLKVYLPRLFSNPFLLPLPSVQVRCWWQFSNVNRVVFCSVFRVATALQLSVHVDLLHTRPFSLPHEFSSLFHFFLCFLRFLFPGHLSGCLCGCLIQTAKSSLWSQSLWPLTDQDGSVRPWRIGLFLHSAWCSTLVSCICLLSPSPCSSIFLACCLT